MKIRHTLNKLFHKCVFNDYISREYSQMYTPNFIIYDQYYCKCGKHKEVKVCGNLEINDIPNVFLNIVTN